MNLEQIIKKIESNKEVLSSMPQNNSKNIEKYNLYVNDLYEEANTFIEKISEEIKKRYNNIVNISINKDIENIKKELIDYSNLKKINNKYKTPYEKSGLDILLDEISHFYNHDLDKVNENIIKIISIFKEIGINLSSKNFDYSPYVNEYMSMFLSNNKDKKLEDCFEKIYWKCPNLIFEISFNFRKLYYKNIKLFEKYYKNKESILNSTEINTKYKELYNKYNNLLENDKYLIINSFLNKENNINDFNDDKIETYYENLSITDKDINTIKDLKLSLKEYKQYKELLLVLDDIKNIYKDKDKYKKVFTDKLKEISKIENNLNKLNNKYNSKLFNNKTKQEKILLDIENNITNVKKLYEELELDKFYELVANTPNNISIYEVLELASSYQIYLNKCLKNNNPDISKEELLEYNKKLEEFILNPNINIFSNIGILEEKDIPLIIMDKYKLLGINITSEDIENNLDGIYQNIKKIIINYNIKNNGINKKDILFAYEVKDIVS